MWAGLAVFVDSVDLPAAQAVCTGILPVEQVLTALTGLIDKSVLTRENNAGAVRYRLLETLREYGLARLRERPATDEPVPAPRPLPTAGRAERDGLVRPAAGERLPGPAPRAPEPARRPKVLPDHAW
jgi:predicted ATPase